MYCNPMNDNTKITCEFGRIGSWKAGKHTGIDLVTDGDRKIKAIGDGVVIKQDKDASYGNRIIIRLVDNRVVLYAHLDSVAVKLNDKVRAGQIIGVYGNTGNSSGPHLHLEIENSPNWGYNANLLNPELLIDLSWNNIPVFPGEFRFGTGKSNNYILQLGQQLVKKGFGKRYKVGPSKSWGESDKLNTQDFQRAQGLTGLNADGLPGFSTWKKLFGK